MTDDVKKPKEYLMEMGIGPDHVILVSPDKANTYKTSATMLKMHGLRFKTKVIAPGSDERFPGMAGLRIMRVK